MCWRPDETPGRTEYPYCLNQDFQDYRIFRILLWDVSALILYFSWILYIFKSCKSWFRHFSLTCSEGMCYGHAFGTFGKRITTSSPFLTYHLKLRNYTDLAFPWDDSRGYYWVLIRLAATLPRFHSNRARPAPWGSRKQGCMRHKVIGSKCANPVNPEIL